MLENLSKEKVLDLASKYRKEYKKNLALLAAPLSLNPAPINDNYYRLMTFYKSIDMFDLGGRDKVDSLNKLIDDLDAKKEAGIHIGYTMPHILYIIELLNEIYEDLIKIDAMLDCE
jgi:hypothetical protein